MKMKNMPIPGQGQTHPAADQGDISSNNFAVIVPVLSGQIGGRETNIASACRHR